MPEPTDSELLARCAPSNSEAAFTALVERYVNLVYSTALRRVGDPQAAEEITQAVFIIKGVGPNYLERFDSIFSNKPGLTLFGHDPSGLSVPVNASQRKLASGFHSDRRA